jgi:hypothetical protein
VIVRLATCGIALLTLLGIAPGAAGAAGAGDSIETPLTLSPDEPSDFTGREPVLDALPTNAVLLVTAGPFEPNVTGLIEQCQLGDHVSCSNELPVRFDDDGRAVFQYLVTQPNPSACRAAAPRCIVRLRAADRTATAVVVFLDLVPEPGRITLRTPSARSAGDRITVEVADFQPGAAYDPMRIGIGLGIATILLLVALFFVRRTDWSAVGEAAAPEIDEAEYADLDAIVAELDAMEADSMC